MFGLPKKLIWIIVAAAVLTVCLITPLVIAKYFKESAPMMSTFRPSTYGNPTIEESVLTDTDGFKYKTNVAVRADNAGYAVYVRLAVIAVWQDGAGNVYGQQPFAGTDYSIEYNDTNWQYRSADGYYYCTSPVQSGALSPAFIDGTHKIKQLKAGPNGYSLHVKLLAQTVQAVGTTDANDIIPAIYDAWGVYFED